MNKLVVYYSSKTNSPIFEPEGLLYSFKNHVKYLEGKGDVLKCPAVVDYYKNIYTLKSTYDYEIEYDGSNVKSRMYDQNFFDFNITERNFEKGYFSYLDPDVIFFTEEKSLVVETLYPFLHPYSENVKMIFGSYDIGKHFRKFETPIWFSSPDKIKFERGKPVVYVKFNTSRQIIFKRFFLTDEMKELMEGIIKVRDFTSKVKKLEFFYDLTEKLRYKLKYLKLIKNNLID